MKKKYKRLTIYAISTLIIISSLNLAAIEKQALAPRSFQLELAKIEELTAAIGRERFQQLWQAKPKIFSRILEEIAALGINPQTNKLLFIELFQEIGLKYLLRLLEEIPEVLPKILAPIRKMGYSQKLQELRVLPFFREIGSENIGPLLIIEPVFLANSLTRLSELGLSKQSDQLKATEITKKLKILPSLTNHIGSSFIRDCRTFAFSLYIIQQMGSDEATAELRAITLLRQIDNERVMAEGLGAVWEENALELSLPLQYLQELTEDGIDIFSILSELKRDEHIQNCLGPAWVKRPYFFLATLAAIHQLGRDENGKLHIWKFFHDIGTEHIAQSWRSQPAAFAEIIRIVQTSVYLQELCQRIGPRFIAEALSERTEELYLALRKYKLLQLTEEEEPAYNEKALGIDWVTCLQQLDNFLNLPAVEELIRQLPPELALNLRLEAFVLLSKNQTPGDIGKLLLDKYTQLLPLLLVYNRYLQTIGLEIEIAQEDEKTFPLAEAHLVCALLGISQGKDLSVLWEYTTPPLRHHSYCEPYYRLFEETGFIPGSKIHSLHLSFPFRKEWGRKKLSDNIDTLALLACLLYSPDDRLLPPHSDAIGKVIEIKENITTPRGEKADWQGKMVRIEIRALAFQQGQNHYRQAARAINLLYSCFDCANKKADERDKTEEQLAAVWESFLSHTRQILKPHSKRLEPFTSQLHKIDSAPQCLRIIKNLRADYPGLIRDLHGLVNKHLRAAEEILAAPAAAEAALIAHYEETLPRLTTYIRRQQWPLIPFLKLFQHIGIDQITKAPKHPKYNRFLEGLSMINEMGVNPQTRELYFLELCREIGSVNIGPPWLQSPTGFNNTLGKIKKTGILQAIALVRRLKKESSLGNLLAPAWENNPFTLAIALKIINETGIDAALAAENTLRQIAFFDQYLNQAFLQHPNLIAVLLEETVQNEINWTEVQTIIQLLQKERSLKDYLPQIWLKSPHSFVYALQNIYASELGDNNQYQLINLLRKIGLQHIGAAWKKDPGKFQIGLLSINLAQVSAVNDFLAKIGIQHIGPAWQANPEAFSRLISRFNFLGFDFILQLFSRLGPRLTREALEKRITAFEHAFWLTNNHDLQPVALDCNWMYCLRQLDTLLFSSAIKSLTEQLPAELVPALRVEAFLLIHNTDKEKQTLNLENIAAQLLSKYAQAGTNKYRYTTGIEIEIDDQYRQIFPIRETAIICALLGLTKAEDASVAFEYAPAPLWRHEQFDPYFRLFEETGFIPGDDICSMHVSAPYDKTWDKEKFEPGLNDLALLTTLLYAPDRRLSRGGTIRDVIRYHNTLILPTGSDTAWQKHMGRVEIRSLAFCKTADHHRQAIKTFNPLYSCLAAFLVKRKDPIEQALSAIWQEFMNKYEELLVPWKIKRDFFHSHAARPNAAIECLQTIKEIRTGDPELREKFKKLLDEYLPRIETVLNSADLPRPVTLPLTETAALCEQAL